MHLNESPVVIVLCGVERDRVYHEFLNGDVAMAALQHHLQGKALGLGACRIGELDREARRSRALFGEGWDVFSQDVVDVV